MVKLLLEHIPRHRAVYNTHICRCKAIAFDADQAKRTAFMYFLNTIMIQLRFGMHDATTIKPYLALSGEDSLSGIFLR